MDLHELAGDERERLAVGAFEGQVADGRREHAACGQAEREMFDHGGQTRCLGSPLY